MNKYLVYFGVSGSSAIVITSEVSAPTMAQAEHKAFEEINENLGLSEIQSNSLYVWTIEALAPPEKPRSKC